MLRVTALLLITGIALAAQEKQPSIDKAKLERWNRLSDEEKAKLRDRLKKFKSMSKEEQERLRRNLRRMRELPPEKRDKIRKSIAKLSKEERRSYSEIASTFFHFARRRGILNKFPRMMFFTWLKNEKPGEVERLQELDRMVRKDAFVRLYYEFKKHAARKMFEHNRRHKCVPAEEFRTLREASVQEFWVKWSSLLERCREKRNERRRGGPVPPRHMKEDKRK